jgi:hypothetical protein
MKTNHPPSVRPLGRRRHLGHDAGLAGIQRTAAPLTPASPAGGAAPSGHGGIHPASPASTGASDVSILGSAGWKVQSSAVATQTGAQISTPGFNTSTWLPVANDDAGAPGTEIEALAQNGKCPGDTALQPVNQAPAARTASSSPPTCRAATAS